MSWWMRDLQNVPWREASLVTAAIRCRWWHRERNADTATAGRASPLSHGGRPCPLPAPHGFQGMALHSPAAWLELLPGKRGISKQGVPVMLSADSLGARAEEKAQIPQPFFKQKKEKKTHPRVFSMFSLLEIKLIP